MSNKILEPPHIFMYLLIIFTVYLDQVLGQSDILLLKMGILLIICFCFCKIIFTMASAMLRKSQEFIQQKVKK